MVLRTGLFDRPRAASHPGSAGSGRVCAGRGVDAEPGEIGA
jgi:hypothetical protein